jgi:hypothetical protein
VDTAPDAIFVEEGDKDGFMPMVERLRVREKRDHSCFEAILKIEPLDDLI